MRSSNVLRGRSIRSTLAFVLAIALLPVGCGAPPDDEATQDPGAPGEEAEDEAVLETKALSSNQPGRPAVKVGVGDGTTRVWTVTAAWSDTTTAAAKKAGLAWGADSGLRWDEKYSRWIESMSATRGPDGNKTFTLTTPFGKSIAMPAVECSEAALLLRALFASWHGLPFFVEASDGKQTIYLGHFGFLLRSGARHPGMPQFEKAYLDYSSRASTLANGAAWPKDNALRKRHLTGSDANDWLEPGAGFGRWADEVVLNKRVGWFLVYLLDWFGSMNLADASNAFHIKPASIRPGDFLLERWRRVGIGHALVVKDVSPSIDNKLEVQLASGSMPRRQPKWEDPLASRDYFLRDVSGGYGDSGDGTAYAALGGGARRFRIAARTSDGYWRNDVATWDKSITILESDLEAIAARTGEFATLLANASPGERRAYLISQLEVARSQLRLHPSSCTNRINREDYFEALQTLNRDSFGVSAEETTRRYRKREDFYFPELSYDSSPTCCWNSTTPAMFEILDRYNREREQSSRQCLVPVAFTKGNQAALRAYAQSIGRGAEWVAWSKDEICPQGANTDDTVAPGTLPAYCSIRDAIARN